MTDARGLGPWVRGARRVVLKIGSSSVSDGRGAPRLELLGAVCREVDALFQGPPRRQVVLVSSGAIALGWPRLGLKRRPSSLPEKQAAAAVGQGVLVGVYETLLAEQGRTCAQVLLTADDLRDRKRFTHAYRTMETLLGRGVIPIVNENDTVAVDEIRVGDNDRLAAMVAVLVEADLLVILSDVDGLYSGDPRRDPQARRIPAVAFGDALDGLVSRRASGGPMGTGGVATKLQAARMAGAAGIPTVLARAEPGVVERLFSGAAVGTFFEPAPEVLRGKKRWLAFYPRSTGAVVIDDGAAQALVRQGRSLLASGVVEVVGEFPAGAVVSVTDPGGQEVGRGIVRFSSDELRRARGRHSTELAAVVSRVRTSWEVVHRDEFVAVAGGEAREKGA
ncbi:glutamate 5-kinase [Carboxydochorda subterranea]|uniref:Glutamate 5-kinase n=1 Tax=Carboxydichorda subterranea TaxID=3109565 RepID=A0ABZ1BZV3_9FIRM|nr:glutamate 5-kinase [Limnochorda sp. L945t]WRP18229.1 glutamate 5-kinase [Limnochorda sp. L945t]